MSGEDLYSYVDRGALLMALKDLTGSNVQIVDGMEVSRATKGVEGFLSLVLRVRVPYRRGEGTTHEATIIVKCMPRLGPQHDLVKVTRAFPREGTFFHQVFPLLRRASAGRVPLPMPTAYHSKYGGDDDAIFMEDLGARGFRTPAKVHLTTGLDLDHCRLAMEAYGRLHALTIVAEKLLPGNGTTWTEAFPEYSKDPVLFTPGVNASPVPFMGMVEQGVEVTLEIARGLEGLPKEAAESGKLKCVLDNTWALMRRLIKPKTSPFRVLTHGDCWMNNSMYRYEKDGMGKPVEVKLLDFQVVRYCHPCCDLINFLYANLRKNLRVKHMDGLVGLYHKSFTDSLKAMNHQAPPFTLEKLLNDIHCVYEGFGYICELLFLPQLLLGEEFIPSDAGDFTQEKFTDFVATGNSSSVRRRYASDPVYRSILDETIRDVVDNIFPNGLDAPVSSLFVP